jgi:hypothetical protein
MFTLWVISVAVTPLLALTLAASLETRLLTKRPTDGR